MINYLEFTNYIGRNENHCESCWSIQAWTNGETQFWNVVDEKVTPKMAAENFVDRNIFPRLKSHSILSAIVQ